MSQPYTEPPLNLIIRFPSALPDLPLTVPYPSTSTALTINQLIRPHLPAPLSTSRLRLIHSGAVLPPTTPLAVLLHLPPPLLNSSPPLTKRDSKGKGKAKAISYAPPSQPSLYIHCSISSPLTPAELASEAAAATASPSAQTASSFPTLQSQNATPSPLSTSPPIGFDRLLASGLSAPEIASLRTQFRAILAHTHTPDDMPSPTSLRQLEDRWLDHTGPDASPTTGFGHNEGSVVGGEPGMGDIDGDEGGGALDDMLWGNLMGFFWPVGAVFWLCREEGVWTRRRMVGVVTGLMVNLAFGVLRVTS